MNKHALIAGMVTGAVITAACGSTPEGRANKAAGPAKSPAAGRVVSKVHKGDTYQLTLRNKGKNRTIYVKASAWDKCPIGGWYNHETCK